MRNPLSPRWLTGGTSPSVATAVLVPSLLAGFLGVLLLYVFVLSIVRTELMQALDADALEMAGKAALAAQTMDDPAGLQRFVADLSALRRLRLVVVSRGDDQRIVASSRVSWVGKTLGAESPLASAAAAGALATRQPQLYAFDRPSPDVLFRVRTRVRGLALPLSGRSSVGAIGRDGAVVVVHVDADATANANLLLRLTGAAVTLLSACLVLTVALVNRRIINPLRQLSHSAVTAASEERALPALSSGTPMEIASIGRAMADAFAVISSQRTRLRAEVELVGGTLAAIAESIFTIDRAGRVRLTNAQGELMTGLAAEALVGVSIDHLLSAEDETGQPIVVADLLEELALLASGGPVVADGDEPKMRTRPALVRRMLRVRDAGGAARVAILTLTQLTSAVAGDDSAPCALLALRDITDEAEANRAKEDFVHAVSHELRTPLTSIHGFISTLLDNPAMPRENQIEFLGIARSQSSRLCRLVNEILEVARLQSGQSLLVVEAVDVVEVARKACLALQDAAREKKIHLEEAWPSGPIIVTSDAGRLETVVTNLLDNAVKFTPAGGRASLGVALAGDQVRITVRDTGIGIPHRAISRIFEKFFRVSGTQVDGTGLGLAIVKETMERLGGRVEVESTSGTGTCFTVVLPVAGPPAAATPPNAA